MNRIGKPCFRISEASFVWRAFGPVKHTQGLIRGTAVAGLGQSGLGFTWRRESLESACLPNFGITRGAWPTPPGERAREAGAGGFGFGGFGGFGAAFGAAQVEGPEAARIRSRVRAKTQGRWLRRLHQFLEFILFGKIVLGNGKHEV